MRTRTLLLLAVLCGLAILVAGSVQLLRLTTDGSAVADLTIGDAASAGDLTVTVESAAETDGFMRVQVRLGGVADDAGADGFRLVVPDGVLEPLPVTQAGAGACGAITVEPQQCTLVFGTAAAHGTPRVLLLRRGEDQRRWTLV
jgi:hypothetical protein